MFDLQDVFCLLFVCFVATTCAPYKDTQTHLQPCPDVYVAAGHLCGAKEDVSTVATCTVDPDRVLASVCLRRVERDLAALAAVGRIGRPSRGIQAGLEALADLAHSKGEYCREGEGDVAKHFCGEPRDYSVEQVGWMSLGGGNKQISTKGETGPAFKYYSPQAPV